MPCQIVALPTDVNGVGSIITEVFVAGHVSCFQMSPYSLWTSLTGVVGSGVDEMNGTPTSPCDFMTEVNYCVRSRVVLLWLKEPRHIVQGRVTGQYYRDNMLTPFVVPFARRVNRRFFCCFFRTTMSVFTIHESSMLTSSSTTSFECHRQQ